MTTNNLQQKIYKDLNLTPMSESHIRSYLKVIIGELQRQQTKDLSDEAVVKILKSLIKSEEEKMRLDVNKPSRSSNIYLNILYEYLPKQISEDVLRLWITDNIDFANLKNKMQAVSIVTKFFGTRVDGKKVSEIISNWEVL